jgi:lysine 2,3-aminomutase
VRSLRGGKATFMVLHANHPRELSDEARAACARVIDAGIPMLSQSVLLRGINDDAETLGALMRALVECRIKPYYLHHTDLASGTAHLRTSIVEGQALMRVLHGRYSGLCQPQYVLDIPGGYGKSPIAPTYVSADASQITDFKGARHAYPPRNFR